MTSPFRRFELGGFLGSAFEVAVDGATLVVRTSKDGKRGRDVVRALATPELAAAEAERLVAVHLAKGYIAATPYEPGPSAAKDRAGRAAIEALRDEAVERAAAQARLDELRARTTYARDEALEQQCRAAPDDPAPWSVYADFLLERGDPRGEYAADPEKRDAILATHGPRLCGTDQKYGLELRHGFAVGATLQPSMKNTIKVVAGEFFGSPMATFITSLRVGLLDFGGTNTWRGLVEELAASQMAPHLRVLRLDAYEYDDCMMHWVSCGSFDDLFARFPVLEELRIRGDTLAFGALPPSLRTYVREGCTTKSAEIQDLAARAWPALEHLEIWFGNRDYGASGSVEDLAPILAARHVPRLTHLGIVNSELADELIPALAASRLLPQLHSLDLRMGTFGGAAVETLVARAAAFRHLASIDLSENLMTDREIERVRAALANVIVAGQRDPFAQDDEGQRYVAEHE